MTMSTTNMTSEQNTKNRKTPEADLPKPYISHTSSLRLHVLITSTHTYKRINVNSMRVISAPSSALKRGSGLQHGWGWGNAP
eukprot:778426-Prymnesium_polylepis.1